MLRNTFIHLPHIGKLTEQRLWENGITTWSEVVSPKNEYAKRFSHINHLLKISEQKLVNQDTRFFTDRLTSEHQWRIFREFQNNTAYLDIETTGLGGPKDHITTIAVYDGNKIFHYVHGKNLEQFKNDIKKFKVLITYNGKCFDIPFIEREFGIRITQSHLDLRYILKSIGLKGGLKSCEHQLGFNRGDLEGVDGYFAVHLWRDYKNGNKKALDTLLAYNIEDTINLEKLMEYAYDKKLESVPLNREHLILLKRFERQKKPLKLPFKPDNFTIEKIRRKYY